MLATTIDEVIERLDAIIADAVRTRSRVGYFAALYKRVTVAVRDKIKENFFDDNQRMERLDVVFANRYLFAHQQYLAGQPCSISWKIAFDACLGGRPLVIQHLLVGMNAHIGLDLGLAAAAVAQAGQIQGVKNDFDKINTVLSGLVDTVQDEIAKIWPVLKLIDNLAGRLDEELAAFSMEIAREAAWQVAVQAAALSTETEMNAFVATRDAAVAGFGSKIIDPGFVLTTIIAVLGLGEIRTVRTKIRILNRA